MEKAKLESPGRPDDPLAGRHRHHDRGGTETIAATLALLAPIRLIERACGQRDRVTMDHLATIIFSSGSTGEPKGVMLSHFSIDANVQAVSQVLPLDAKDRILGILPLFHSFGYLVFWYRHPQWRGDRLSSVPARCDSDRRSLRQISPHLFGLHADLSAALPTSLYTRTVQHPSSGLAGSGETAPSLCQSFEDRFGISPIEGYGVTECAPVIAVNCPDFRATGFFQPASRRGTVGRPLPGVSVRIVDPDSFELLPPDTPGMLLVKGPNVMSGYLGHEDLTAQVIRDGWYITGDIATLDDDGFLTITDRLSRFSKIGGEMVPHRRVEEALQLASGEELQMCAVTGVPDDRRGEQLAVLHTLVTA